MWLKLHRKATIKIINCTARGKYNDAMHKYKKQCKNLAPLIKFSTVKFKQNSSQRTLNATKDDTHHTNTQYIVKSKTDLDHIKTI